MSERTPEEVADVVEGCTPIAHNMAAATCSQRLRNRGWDGPTAYAYSGEICQGLAGLGAGIFDDLASDLARAARNGADDDVLRGIVLGAFANAAVDLADSLERRRRDAAQSAE